jgi:hypothetical protein
MHILAKVKNCKEVSKEISLHAGFDNLSPGTLNDNRKDLLKVPTKNNKKTTKWLVKVPQVFEGAIDSLYDMLVLHGCLISNH